jgi:hypothetical protein
MTVAEQITNLLTSENIKTLDNSVRLFIACAVLETHYELDGTGQNQCIIYTGLSEKEDGSLETI